jgi:hypothetical protein
MVVVMLVEVKTVLYVDPKEVYGKVMLSLIVMREKSN